MKISYQHYELLACTSIRSQHKRKGSLLRFEFDDGILGYADCHPWVELGDLPLDQQLDLLAQGRMTAVTERSLFFARLDAEARAHDRNLFSGLFIPLSHYLITDFLHENVFEEMGEALNKGFTYFKLKLGSNLPSETNKLKNLLKRFENCSFLLRLDFNAKLTKKAFCEFLVDIEFARQNIDFYEDPFPYEPNEWKEVQDEYKVHLACDYQSQKAIGQPDSAKVLVIKPASQCEKEFNSANQSKQRLIVTSYLDHPLGQLSAAYVAAKTFKISDQCGLLSQHAYQVNEFSERLKNEGARLIPPSGTGFGFDDLLENVLWKKLLV